MYGVDWEFLGTLDPNFKPNKKHFVDGTIIDWSFNGIPEQFCGKTNTSK